jgi:hypothetical protein
MVRELANVLPQDVWLVNAAASSVAADTTATGTPAAPATPGAPTTPSTGGPTLKLQGCARNQDEVAVTLVRLKELEGATDVQLEHSTRGEDTGTVATGPTAPTGTSSGGDASCGDTNGKPNYSFEADISFAPATGTSEPGNVPRRLGGGA